MVQGRVQGAIEWYKRARRTTRDFFPSDPRLATSNDVLAIELDLERNRVKAIQQRKLQGFTELRGIWNEIYAVAVAVRAELTFEQFDGRAVIEFLGRTVEDVRRMGARSLETYLSALLAYYLVRVGRTAEAAQVWKDHALPCETSDLLDLDGQSWRRMEALSCARVALLVAQDDLRVAEELASAGRLVGASWQDYVLRRPGGLDVSLPKNAEAVLSHGVGEASRARRAGVHPARAGRAGRSPPRPRHRRGYRALDRRGERTVRHAIGVHRPVRVSGAT